MHFTAKSHECMVMRSGSIDIPSTASVIMPGQRMDTWILEDTWKRVVLHVRILMDTAVLHIHSMCNTATSAVLHILHTVLHITDTCHPALPLSI